MNEIPEEVAMEVNGLILDPTSNVPIVILRDREGEYLMPIQIGIFEANAIAMRMEGIETPRPMTHDLLLATIEQLNAHVERVVITDLRDNTFFALIHLDVGESGELELDARPSDAIALALRAKVPVFVARPVLEKAKLDDLTSKLSEEEKLKKWLEEINPEDLGKYTM